MASSSNQFEVLNYGVDNVCKELDPYLGIPELGSAIETFKACLINNSPNERLNALRIEVNHAMFISGSNNRYDRLYSIIRVAMVKYGINCTTSLPNGAPVWKKVVNVIWPSDYQTICDAREGTDTGDNNTPPLPPVIPELEEAKDD